MQNIGSGTGRVGRLRALAGALGFAGLITAGCASNINAYPPPTQSQLAGAESNVKLAREGGAASSDPKAARLVRGAEEQLATAKDRAAAGDNRGATLLLARAEADAELGHLLARQSKAKGEADLLESQLAETRRVQTGGASAPSSTTTSSSPSSTSSTSSSSAAPGPSAPPLPSTSTGGAVPGAAPASAPATP